MTTVGLIPAMLLGELEADGFTVTTDGAKVVVSPASKLNPGQREGIVRWKADLIALLAEREALDREVLARPPPLASVGWVVVPEPRRASGSAGRSDQRAGGPPSSPAATTGMFGAGS
jgi:hypothetical protein